jgi:hypothetical protein
MSTTLRRISGLLFVALSGCAAFDKGHLDPKVASQVKVSRLDPPAGCAYLGGVRGGTPLGDLDDADGDVLRKAVLRGGNYVAVDMVERPMILGLGSYMVHGRLFSCPLPAAPLPQTAAAAPAPPAAPASPRACEPECAAGFTCQLGACIAVPSPQAAGPAN